MSAAKAIKERLTELNMTQTELASALGTTKQNLANKMARDNLSAKELCAIAEVLGVKLVLKGEESKEYIIEYFEE